MVNKLHKKCKMENKQLFYYGLKAKIKSFGGVILILLGFIFGMIHVSLFFICLIIGVILIFKGKSQRFDYKMKSGYIVHSGDS